MSRAETVKLLRDDPGLLVEVGASEESALQTASDPGPYRIADGHICVERMKEHGPVRTPLCNFVARIAEEIILDDGAETALAFEIEGQLSTGERLAAVRIPASRFSGMFWVSERWGARAVVSAGFGARDQLREAIQRLSLAPRRRHVFTHTGWREIDGQWIFLTADGAVGLDGFEVDLGPELARYALPRVPENPGEAMRASLRLLKVAPFTVTGPVWAGMFRAPLASALPLDVTLWLEGQTGALKSTLAAVFLSHFGEFTRTSLPGVWSSTANALERRAFTLKDIPFVVDDYAPNAIDARDLEAKAARLVRAQGNLAGRGRLRADLTERSAHPPRGVIIATGEQHPPGQSLLARTLIVEVERDKVDLGALTEAQRMAHRLPHAMAGYIGWLGSQMKGLPRLLEETFQGARERATAGSEHLRVPEAVAHLWVGLDCALDYAVDVGACEQAEAKEHRAQAWEALLALGRAQVSAVESERPSLRFLRVLSALLTQHRALLLPKEESGDGLGPEAGLIGWIDAEELFLLPEPAFQAVARFCRDSGEHFSVRQVRLWRDLDRENYAECDLGRHSTTARVGGRVRRVVRLNRAKVEAAIGEELGRREAGETEVTDVTGFKE